MEYVAQKARREVKTKAKEEAEKWRIIEKEEKKKMLKYIQWLQNKVIAENTVGSQVVGSKYKEVTSKDKKVHWLSKKTKEKYHGVTQSR